MFKDNQETHKNEEVLGDKDNCYPPIKKVCKNKITGMVKKRAEGRKRKSEFH